MRRSKCTLTSFKLLEEFDHNISNGNLNTDMVCNVYNYLKANGRSLDENLSSREQMDYYFNEYRNLIRSNHLDLISKCYLLQLIELRAMRWISSSDSNDFYDQKLSELQETADSTVDSSPLRRNPSSRYLDNQLVNSVSSSALSSGATGNSPVNRQDILKDELMIRNADSGKVMGIRGRRVRLIEELSDTIISFQRVNSGARDRLLQITGSSDEAIKRAKKLILDTIRRNASPVAFDMPDKSSASNSARNTAPKRENVTFDEDNSRDVKSPIEIKGLQRSSSLGYALAKKDYMITESIDTGNIDEILKVSSNSSLILTECIQVLTSHFELKKSMKRYLPDFEFEESFSDSEQSDGEFENEIRRNRQRHSTNTSNDVDSSDMVSLVKSNIDDIILDDSSGGAAAEHKTTSASDKVTDVPVDKLMEKQIEKQVTARASRSPTGGNALSPPREAEPSKAPRGMVDEVATSTGADVPAEPSDVPPLSSPSALLTYDRQFLLDCSKSRTSQDLPQNIEEIRTSASEIIKD